jgi:hypothetical protein
VQCPNVNKQIKQEKHNKKLNSKSYVNSKRNKNKKCKILKRSINKMSKKYKKESKYLHTKIKAKHLKNNNI